MYPAGSWISCGFNEPLVRRTGDNPGLWLASLARPAIKGVCHKGLRSARGFVISTFIVLLVLEKFQASSACSVSQIKGSVTGGTLHFHGKPKTPFALHHSYHLGQQGLHFLRLSLGVNFLDLVRFAFFVLSCRMPLASLVKPQKGLLVWVTSEINKSRQWML